MIVGAEASDDWVNDIFSVLVDCDRTNNGSVGEKRLGVRRKYWELVGTRATDWAKRSK